MKKRQSIEHSTYKFLLASTSIRTYHYLAISLKKKITCEEKK